MSLLWLTLHVTGTIIFGGFGLLLLASPLTHQSGEKWTYEDMTGSLMIAVTAILVLFVVIGSWTLT